LGEDFYERRQSSLEQESQAAEVILRSMLYWKRGKRRMPLDHLPKSTSAIQVASVLLAR
jgi:hypothetical protein